MRTYSQAVGGSLERKMPMPEQQHVDQQRIRYGLWIILTGFALVALITIVSIFKWNDVTSVATAIGATTSLVGTVVGSFLGVQVGSAGKERVETDRQRLEDTVRLALSMLPPEVAKQLQEEMKR
jgi:high-affinity K+ transport system ATPase subunit B